MRDGYAMSGPMIRIVTKGMRSIYSAYGVRIKEGGGEFHVFVFTTPRLSDYDEICVSANHEDEFSATGVVSAIAESIESGKKIYYMS